MRWPWHRRPDPLGDGVWRRAHDRFRRAVDRYHQMIETVPDGGLRDGLERTGSRLTAALDDVRDLCLTAQQQAPSADLDVPGGPWARVHHAISSAATCVAQAAQAAAMARVAAPSPDADLANKALAAAQRAAAQVEALVRSARTAVPGGVGALPSARRSGGAPPVVDPDS